LTNTEKKIRQQLTDALVNRAQTDERIAQLRAMLGAVQEMTNELGKAKADAELAKAAADASAQQKSPTEAAH